MCVFNRVGFEQSLATQRLCILSFLASVQPILHKVTQFIL